MLKGRLPLRDGATGVRERRGGIAAALVVAFFAPLASAEDLVDARVEQASPGSYQLQWSGTSHDTPVDVYVAWEPDAPVDQRRLVVDDNREGQAVVRLAEHQRPYFFVRPGNGKGLWIAERLLPLEGGRNFRDLGGYRTSDGQRVKWGKIYRSGTMSELTDADYQYLSALGIRVVCDFRSTAERVAQPNEWQQKAGIAYWARDYDASFGDLGKVLSKPAATPVEVQAIFAAGYRVLPFEQAAAYREMFARLVAGEMPLAFNCSEGKDRAGVAAALILTALGVPRATVVADYELSGKIIAHRRAANGDAKLRDSYPQLANVPPEVLAPLFSADPAYIEAMFAAVEQRHGSVAGYLRDVLGVSDHDLEVLRAQLLE